LKVKSGRMQAVHGNADKLRHSLFFGLDQKFQRGSSIRSASDWLTLPKLTGPNIVLEL
jgi:hypothetical protein